MRILLLALAITNFCFAQTSYETGYFIANDGSKMEGFIKDEDWLHNPTAFKFRKNIDSETITKNLEAIKEFGIDSIKRYVRHQVQLDMSSSNINDLSKQRYPEYEEKTIFLKVLVGGKATLYYYESPGIQRFYYSLDQSDPEPLIYKKYSFDQVKVSENNTYIYQLKEKLNCDLIKEKEMLRIKYRKKDLVQLFTSYNSCYGAQINYQKKDTESSRKKIEVKIRPGVHYSRITSNKGAFNPQLEPFDYDTELGFRIGLEGEFFLPFNNNKWSLFAEPLFQSYSSTKSIANRNFDVTYQTLQLGVGGRHYMYLNPKSKLLIDLGVLISYRISEEEIRISNSFDTPLRSDSYGFALGIGYQYKRIVFQIKHIPSYSISPGPSVISYGSTEFIIGYTLF